MSSTVLYMSMSLDGFIAGPNVGPDNGLGDGGTRLHEWVLPGAATDHKAISGRLSGANGQVVDEFMSTGAVVAGRGTFEPAGGWGGDHHDGVPIFILTRREPDSLRQWPLVTYVSDVRTAMAEAKRAAGDKDVLVHGAGTAQLALAAGVLDEIEIHLIPVLLGQGRRLFDNLGPEHIELERVRTLEGGRRHPPALPGPALRNGHSAVHVPPVRPGRRLHPRPVLRQPGGGRARRRRSRHGGDAALRALDEPVRDDVRPAAGQRRRGLPRADLHAGDASCRSPGIRRSAPATRGSRPAARRATGR